MALEKEMCILCGNAPATAKVNEQMLFCEPCNALPFFRVSAQHTGAGRTYVCVKGKDAKDAMQRLNAVPGWKALAAELWDNPKPAVEETPAEQTTAAIA